MKEVTPPMKAILVAAALLAASTLAYGGPQEELTRILTEASGSSNPSVSFLESIGSLGNADLNASQVAAAVEAAPVHPALRPVLDRVSRIRISGSTVRFDFTQAFAINLAGQGYAHFRRSVSFELDGRTLRNFNGFKLSQSLNGLKATPRSIRFGTHDGVPTATVSIPIVGTRRIPLVQKSAELETPGLTGGIRFG